MASHMAFAAATAAEASFFTGGARRGRGFSCRHYRAPGCGSARGEPWRLGTTKAKLFVAIILAHGLHLGPRRRRPRLAGGALGMAGS